MAANDQNAGGSSPSQTSEENSSSDQEGDIADPLGSFELTVAVMKPSSSSGAADPPKRIPIVFHGLNVKEYKKDSPIECRCKKTFESLLSFRCHLIRRTTGHLDRLVCGFCRKHFRACRYYWQHLKQVHEFQA